jgi:hypothetical protein
MRDLFEAVSIVLCVLGTLMFAVQMMSLSPPKKTRWWALFLCVAFGLYVVAKAINQ